jgi:5-oxopent-3-ene-1,2,5-tricarboxylate decarboxylase/2-hydroxyhepta-2,4-diene-1,7-dioate isomerase
MTLYPGDVIMTGTPAHPPRLAAGDVVEIVLEGLPPLKNPCVAEDLPSGIAARALDDVG